MADTTLTFHPSYGPADVRRALARFPDATLAELLALRDAVACRRNDARTALGQAQANAHDEGQSHARRGAASKRIPSLRRSLDAWIASCEVTEDRVRAATMTSIAKADATGEYDRPLAPAPAADPPPARTRAGSMMALAHDYLRANGPAQPKAILAGIRAAGWTSDAPTPDATLRAALSTAARKGILVRFGRGHYGMPGQTITADELRKGA